MIRGLSEIAARYDACLIDQYGVIHDGHRPFPGALAALDALAALGKPVAVLTNSGKRAAANQARLHAMGLADHHMAAVVSSGEVAWQGLADGSLGRPAGVYLLGKTGDQHGFDDLGLNFVAVPEDAEMILILGCDIPKVSLASYGPQLKAAAGRGIPALCCNPDHLMMSPKGLVPAPGAIAALYAQMGGPVTLVGKPEPLIYRYALAALGNPDPARSLAIGDSAAHDVRGAKAQGLATLLVLTGVSEGLSEAELEPAPDWCCAEFRW